MEIYQFFTKKKDSIPISCPFLEKVFLLLMGCSKNYIMYWGLRLLVYHLLKNKCAQTLQISITFFVDYY